MITEEFFERYNKSVEEGYDDYTLIDYSQIKPDKNNYKDFDNYWQELCNYLDNKYRYTYGSKAKKKT
jgi:hypothetical protein